MDELKQIKYQNPSDKANEDTYVEKDSIIIVKSKQKEKEEKENEQIPEIEVF